MPYKDPVKSAAYKLAHSRLPKERAKQRARRLTPGFKETQYPVKRKSMLKQRYGITHEDYLHMLTEQNGACAVCKTTVTGNRCRYFDVDHDHETGKVRGLLCRRCNVTLGVIEKNRERIMLLEKYLREYDPKDKR